MLYILQIYLYILPRRITSIEVISLVYMTKTNGKILTSLFPTESTSLEVLEVMLDEGVDGID